MPVMAEATGAVWWVQGRICASIAKKLNSKLKDLGIAYMTRTNDVTELIY